MIPNKFLILGLYLCVPNSVQNSISLLDQKAKLFKRVIESQHESKTGNTWFLISSRNTSLIPFFGEDCDESPLVEHLLHSFHSMISAHASSAVVGDGLGKVFRKQHVTFVCFQMIVPLCPTNILEKVEKVRSNGSKRKDHYLFTSNDEITLLQAFQHPIVIKLKEKIGIAWDSLTLFEEPKIFDPSGQTLTRVENTGKWKPKVESYLGQNLAGRHIRISASILPPYFYIKPENDPESIDYYDGNHYRIFSETYRKFNYTFEVQSTPVGEGYGDLLPNGTWTGMIAKVYYEERGYDAVIILGPLIVWYDMFDFAGSMGVAHLLFLTSHPTLELNSEAFLNPYTRTVWIGTVASYFSVGFTLAVILIFSKANKFQSFQYKIKSFGSTLQTTLTITFKIALEQNGASVIPNLRILTGIWMISTIITGTGYKCNLVSHLSSPTAVSVPNTYEQLAARKDYKIILNNIGAAEYEFFQTSQGTTVQSLRRRMKFIPDPIVCATEALVNPKTACIAWCPFMTLTAAGALTLDTNRSPLLFSKQGTLTTSISVAFQKDSIYADAFIPLTQILYEAGFYNRWESDAIHYHKQIGRQRMLSMKDSDAYKTLSAYETTLNRGLVNPFTVKNLRFSFYMVIIGGIIGVTALICEWGYNGLWNKNINQVQEV